MNSRLLGRALGSFLGLAIGDALGATVEFMQASEIAAEYRVHNQLIGGGWLHLKPGQVTDDSEMTLALGSALIASGGWNPQAIADAFVAWMRRRPVDIGNTCRRGISRYVSSGSLFAAPAKESGGNGAAMRNLPTVFVSLGCEDLLVQRSLEQAHITHHHPESDAATAALACMTRRLLLDGGIAACEQVATDLTEHHPVFRFRPWPGKTSGYIVDTVQTVLDGFFNTSSFEECLVRVVNHGGDADTNGALAGQLAGGLYGVEALPSRWLSQLDSAVTAAIYGQTQKLLELSAR
jgi:ADP-ribosyl-[dinitrogen reductase] hydrolase